MLLLGNNLSAQNTTENEVRNGPLVPLTIQYLTCAFYFVYMGCSSGFSSWITTYALDVGVTNSKGEAAYLVSVYWSAMTGGK